MSSARLLARMRARHGRRQNPVEKVAGGRSGVRLVQGSRTVRKVPGGDAGASSVRAGLGYPGPYYGYAYWLYPWYGYGYPYVYPYAYGYPYYAATSRETVPSACCYDAASGVLYCPGSRYDGAPAFAKTTRTYKGRLMSYVSSPKLAQPQWFWDCPDRGEAA